MVHVKRESLDTTYAKLRLGEAQAITCLKEESQYKFLGVMGSDWEKKWQANLFKNIDGKMKT